MSGMKNINFKYLYRRTEQLLMVPETVWPEALNETNSGKELYRNYLIPITMVISIMVLLINLINYNFWQATGLTIINLIAMLIGNWFAYLITREYLCRKLSFDTNLALNLTVYSGVIFIIFHSIGNALGNIFLGQLFTDALQRTWPNPPIASGPENQYSRHQFTGDYLYSSHYQSTFDDHLWNFCFQYLIFQFMPNEVNIRNKRASFDYEFLEEYNAGIVLTGTEIKSIRAGKASLVDSYCFFNRGELWVKGMHIAEYKLGTYYNHEEKRERKLLLTHKELIKLQRKVKESGLTIVPVKVFLNEKGYAKLRIALAKGKKEFDKRESLKLKDAKKDMERAMKR